MDSTSFPPKTFWGRVAARFDLAAENPWLFLLALIQFTVVIDYLIMSPLGPQLIHRFHITASQFGHAMAVYAVSAGLSALGASFFMDRFDRKTALLVLYAGFSVSNLLCGLSGSFTALLLSRILAGACGGTTMGVVMAMIGDKIPPRRRAEASGLVMSAFAVASTFGVPMGIALMSWGDWHTPFVVLSGLSALTAVLGLWLLPTFHAHLVAPRKESAWERFRSVLADRNHIQALLVSGAITLAGVMIVPYLSTYLVQNVGLKVGDLAYTYGCAGICALVSMNLIGRWADQTGKYRAFVLLSCGSITVTLFITHLPPLSLYAVIPFSCAFMIFLSGRGVPVMALITGSVDQRHRGNFMSLNSAVQHLTAGAGVSLSGLFFSQTAEGHIVGFGRLGFASAFFALLGVWLARGIRPAKNDFISVVGPAKATETDLALT